MHNVVREFLRSAARVWDYLLADPADRLALLRGHLSRTLRRHRVSNWPSGSASVIENERSRRVRLGLEMLESRELLSSNPLNGSSVSLMNPTATSPSSLALLNAALDDSTTSLGQVAHAGSAESLSSQSASTPSALIFQTNAGQAAASVNYIANSPL
jgi:hypothetical protein